MAMRSLWKGQLRLSLVSIAVELYSATRTGARVSFRQIHEPSGKRIKYEKVAEGIGPVDKDDIVKGYEYEKNNYVLLKPEEIESVKLESKKTFELVQFVEACEIPPLYFDKPYYLVPADDLAQDAYRVVRDALRQTSRVGIGQITLRGHEYLAAVKPCGDGLLLETLHYADEIRNADPLFSSIKDEAVSEDLLDVATALIEKKTAPFDAATYKDHYSDALKALIAEKMKSKSGKRVQEEDETPVAGGRQDNVVDLMAALKKSLEGAGKGGSKTAAARKGPARKTSSGVKSSGKTAAKAPDKTPATKARKKRA
ncbi:Ku protein [Allohahella sp. A8]|uniref:non-homologous end joining protein Ku n=1 Tax=Allohahella sp. A8 TaxID=3141461 RepID=UPI000C09176D|nr:Ku protein [Hahellaceae bacterium]|tara:strand:- start:27823 stop:28758 length:936 start_codon:yes stop_codon:yes gene_type:complete